MASTMAGGRVAALERVGRDVGVQYDEAHGLPEVGAASGVGVAEDLVQLLVGVEHVACEVIHRLDRPYALAARQLVESHPAGRTGRHVVRVVAARGHPNLLVPSVARRRVGVILPGRTAPAGRWP